ERGLVLLEPAGRLIPLPSLSRIPWPGAERGCDRGRRPESSDACPDPQVVAESTIDLGNAQIQFGSPIHERLHLRPSGGQSCQLGLRRFDGALRSSSDLGLTLELAPCCVDLGLVLATA